MTVLGYIACGESNCRITIDWHHVDGKLNPVDSASRQIMTNDDVDLHEWLQGPSFLLTDVYPKETRNKKKHKTGYCR